MPEIWDHEVQILKDWQQKNRIGNLSKAAAKALAFRINSLTDMWVRIQKDQKKRDRKKPRRYKGK